MSQKPLFSVELKKGTHQVLSFPVHVDEGGKAVDVDLTGATAVAELRKDSRQPLILRLESNAADPLASIQFQGSSILLKFTPADTQGATWDAAEMDILLTLSNGMRSRTSRFGVTLDHGITEA